MNKKIWLIFSIFFLIMIIFSGYKILTTMHQYKASEEIYNELERYVNIEVEETADNTNQDNKYPVIDFESLKKVNKDIIAYIFFENLDISYPIVKGKDNDYYLKHLIDGKYNKSGSIFLDYRNKSDLTDKHSIIYGHNMLNGGMFSSLTKYKEQKIYDENPFYYIITPEKNYTVEIFSGYVTNVNDEAWELDFTDKDEYKKWLEESQGKSIFSSRFEPTENDRIVTLSTCSYEYENAKFVLLGVLNEEK